MPKSKSTTPTQIEIELPDKKYFTIGEVADLCDLKSHVLRYWEQVFPQLEPSKRSGRRYYQRNDVELILEIKSLLHDQGFTIPGAKARLAKSRVNLSSEDIPEEKKDVLQQLQTIKAELQEFRAYLQKRY
ncbi:MerR family transcriptional regulator [Thiomicrorhabdus sp. ZW0627]|uniref:MerR family transcriptional regulator n=1 Tax=Thiomicrorhabdus sp. ZW0627 TaxID=3039774 RepID=UPI002436BDBA|nr:MerR family transcriptional regulator [Thiomicrorhabdus sp. ZW0627]MDG6774116.1 MerR family transcriptional regulator [Thiomicrorhabdus sp. ZW0627]